MGRPLKWTVEQKLPLVLSILRGEGSVAEIGRHEDEPKQDLRRNWSFLFRDLRVVDDARSRSCGLL